LNARLGGWTVSDLMSRVGPDLHSLPDPEPDPPQQSPAPAAHGQVALARLELYTVWGREAAWVRAGSDRTSDWLNRGDAIEVYDVESLPLDGEGIDVAASRPPTHLSLSERLAADVLFVVPPTLRPNRHLQLHRRIADVRMELASFVLTGRAHIRPGIEAGDFLLRGNRRFVPITHVELRYTGEPSFSRQVPVVIVNVTHVTLLDRSLGAAVHDHDDPPVPAPAAPDGASTAAGLESFANARMALEQLADLARDGLITPAELRRKRAQILERL
jgi:hypothetical protein